MNSIRRDYCVEVTKALQKAINHQDPVFAADQFEPNAVIYCAKKDVKYRGTTKILAFLTSIMARTERIEISDVVQDNDNFADCSICAEQNNNGEAKKREGKAHIELSPRKKINKLDLLFDE